jgi:hypothetical protein
MRLEIKMEKFKIRVLLCCYWKQLKSNRRGEENMQSGGRSVISNHSAELVQEIQ